MADWQFYQQTEDLGYPDTFERCRAYYGDLELRLDPTVNPRPLSLYRINWDASPPTRTLISTASYTDPFIGTGLASLGNGKFLSVSAKATSGSAGSGIGWVIGTAGGVLSVGPQLSLNASSATGYNFMHLSVADADTVVCLTSGEVLKRWFTTNFTDTVATEVADVSLVVSPARDRWINAITPSGHVVLNNYLTGTSSSDMYLELRDTSGALLQNVDLDPTTTLALTAVTSYQGHTAAHGGVDALGRAVIPVYTRNASSSTAAAEARIYDVSAGTLNQVGALTVASVTGTGVLIDFNRLMRLGTTGSRFVGCTAGSVIALFIVDTEAMTVESLPVPPSEVGHDVYELTTADEDSFWIRFSGGEYLYHLGSAALVDVIMQGELLTQAAGIPTDPGSGGGGAGGGGGGGSLGTVLTGLSGITHYWPLAEDAGDAVGGLGGVAHGAVSYSATGASFGGSSYLEVPDHTSLSLASQTSGELTIVAIMAVSDWASGSRDPHGTGYCFWMGKGNPAPSGTSEYHFRHYYDPDTSGQGRTKRVSCYHFNLPGGLGAGSFVQDTGGTVATGVENLYVARFDSYSTSPPAGSGASAGDWSSAYPGQVELFKNGVRRDTDGFDGGAANYHIHPQNGSAPFRIGTGDTNSFFKGTIRDVAIYNRKLTDAEITSIQTAFES